MVPIVGAEDKKPILDDRPTERPSRLILLKQGSLCILANSGVCVVSPARARPLASHIVLVTRSVPLVGARLRHKTQMIAQVGAVLRVRVSLYAKFINRFRTKSGKNILDNSTAIC